MSGAVTAVAAAVVATQVFKPSGGSAPAPAPAPAPVQQVAAPAPVAAPAQQAAPAPEPAQDAASALYRTTSDTGRQATSPQATRARRGGGASGATMLSGPRGVEGQAMALSGGNTLLGS